MFIGVGMAWIILGVLLFRKSHKMKVSGGIRIVVKIAAGGMLVLGVITSGYGIAEQCMVAALHDSSQDVALMRIQNGSTGEVLEITDEAVIQAVTTPWQDVSLSREKVSIGYMGYSFRITLYDAQGKPLKGLNNFYVNADTVLRKDPFFYTVTSGSLGHATIEALFEEIHEPVEHTDTTGVGNTNHNASEEVLDVDTIVTQLLLAETERYLSGECPAEGHILLGQSVEGDDTFLYVLTMLGNYGFENGYFNKISGSGVLPVVITLDAANQAGIEYPMDGSAHVTSIKQMFPEIYHETIWDALSGKNEMGEALTAQEVAYAEAYLKVIGRDAAIEVPFERQLLTDKGISVEVSNQLETFYKAHTQYPWFIGTQEYIEDGVRMVYEMQYTEGASEIVFVKYRADTGEVVEKFYFDAQTGAAFEG